MRRLTLFITVLLSTLWAAAQKSLYIPLEWRTARTDTLLWAESDPDNRYTCSKSRSKETDNCIVLWDKYYGNTSPSQAPAAYRVDIDDLLRQAEQFYDLELNTLGFVNPQTSNLSKYKVMILLNHSTEWICYGAGYDFQVPALWLSPSTCHPVGHAVAHEIGHSFHYMCYSEASRHGADADVQTGFHEAVGNGSVTWEQTAQWQACQSFPELMFQESMGVFRNSHNYAFTHEWHRYQSYWFLYYLCQHYGDITTVANVWNTPESKKANNNRTKDFNEVLMDCKQLSTADLFRLYYDYASRLSTWDLDACTPYRNSQVGNFAYRCVSTAPKQYQVALASCPQSTGFNIIPLQVPAAGTTVTTRFTALPSGTALADGDPAQVLNGESQLSASGMKAYTTVANRRHTGFRLGYVALLSNGTRIYHHADSVYSAGQVLTPCEFSISVPEATSRLWLIVVPAPSVYYQHRWDETTSTDDQWPYRFELEGTDISTDATVYSQPVIDGRPVADATITYDVTFPSSATQFPAIDIAVGGQAAQTLGTAFQLSPSSIASKMQNYSTAGPSTGRIMFYAANAVGKLIDRASTANGYGHWFADDGTVINYPNGVVYSEFNPASLTFTLGQMPGLCKHSNTYTIAQALRYNAGADTEAKVLFVFNIRIDDQQTPKAELKHTEYIPASVTTPTYQPYHHAVYDIGGRRTTKSKGIYIKNGKKTIGQQKGN